MAAEARLYEDLASPFTGPKVHRVASATKTDNFFSDTKSRISAKTDTWDPAVYSPRIIVARFVRS